MIMATVFVALPLVIREVVPVLEEIGDDQEQAARSLGANAVQTFRRITLPGIKWAVVYGVVLSLARSLGEFGAVKIVSGNITGQSQTATLFVEETYQNFQQQASYSIAALLAFAAMVCLVVVAILRPKEHKNEIHPNEPLAALAFRRGPRMSINVSGVTKKFGDFVALDDVSVDLPTGQLTALLGPSGGGKSTLLRIIAGLESADDGTVTIEGNEATHLPPQKRNVGFVFQHYAAFKHMSVAKNVAFGLEIRKRSKDEVKRRVDELLELVHLTQFAHRLPSQLSGGQRQRMALARALAVEPSVLLLDEPFGALDAKVRKELRDWLRRLHDEVHVTTVFVTHDQEEALEVADEIVVINDGRIEQIGSPDQLYDEPGQRLRDELPRPGHDAGRQADPSARHRGVDAQPDRGCDRRHGSSGGARRLRGAAHGRGRPARAPRGRGHGHPGAPAQPADRRGHQGVAHADPRRPRRTRHGEQSQRDL